LYLDARRQRERGARRGDARGDAFERRLRDTRLLGDRRRGVLAEQAAK
jgi:hypothetical protein